MKAKIQMLRLFLALFLVLGIQIHSHESAYSTDKESTSGSTKKIYLQDYSPPDFLIPKTQLHFDLGPQRTIVCSELQVVRQKKDVALVLNAEDIEILHVMINGEELDTKDYIHLDNQLIIYSVPEDDSFSLRILNEFNPEENKELSGLYYADGMFCTQCESEGFRRITPFLDRPDVMSCYTVTILADPVQFPTLLSNGNLIHAKQIPDGRFEVTYDDPFPKPSYLFGLIAGDLAVVTDEFVTMSGKNVALEIHVEHGQEGRVSHAMDSLKRAMAWDEEVFGREYDLETLRLAAVRAFNMGAMENKGLLIFNETALIGDGSCVTDGCLYWIEDVVAHEYFHNWTGNRVTVRDWFQLALKEGLTNFRNQEFSADMNSRTVTRINDVQVLRTRQFPEDAGPLAHPVLPKKFTTPDDSYSCTTYLKGAEIYRMMLNLLGKERFRQGMDQYFATNDGKAVTIQHVLAAMQSVADRDISQFARWFDQPGTPLVEVSMAYFEDKKEAHLTVKQLPPKVVISHDFKPFYFPLAVGLMDDDGFDFVLDCDEYNLDTTINLHIDKDEETFVFKNIPSRPIPSLLRNFSAPVKLDYPYTQGELCLLMAKDSDLFNRYDASQRLATMELENCISAIQAGTSYVFSEKLLKAYGNALNDDACDNALRAEILTLPSVDNLIADMEIVDIDAAVKARERLKTAIANRYEDALVFMVDELNIDTPYQYNAVDTGKRALKNACLSYLGSLPGGHYLTLVAKHFESSNNMTDTLAAISILCQYDHKLAHEALHTFHCFWENDPLVLNNWITAHASCDHENLVDDLKALCFHETFDIHNPNNMRCLLRAFFRNLKLFHNISGKGYEFLVDKIIEIDEFNRIMATMFVAAFELYPRLDSVRQELMRAQLERLCDPSLSKETRGAATRILNSLKEENQLTGTSPAA
ncbi:Puromycin-sensitive aminopeptidase [Chlamydiales bacterium SCGC AG-110-M15]|nr:Puromycin-sensitive aminopeptidase [Chlamydiales bacterium SCGC AG-110-M15]